MKTSKYPVARDVAEQEFARMCESRRIDLDDSEWTDQEKEKFEEVRNDIVTLIRRGLLTVAEDGTPTYAADGGKTFTFHIPTGATFMAMESHAPTKQVSNTVAAVTEMTRSAAGELSKLSVWDFRAVMRIGSFFLEQ